MGVSAFALRPSYLIDSLMSRKGTFPQGRSLFVFFATGPFSDLSLVPFGAIGASTRGWVLAGFRAWWPVLIFRNDLSGRF